MLAVYTLLIHDVLYPLSSSIYVIIWPKWPTFRPVMHALQNLPEAEEVYDFSRNLSKLTFSETSRNMRVKST